MYFLTLYEFIKLNEEILSNLVNRSELIRTDKAKNIIVEYKKIKQRTKTNRTKTIEFYANDPLGSNKTHTVSIQIPDYKLMSKFKRMSTQDKIEFAIQAGNVNVYCDCADFLYKGYKYMATDGGYGIYTEKIPPDIKNPNRTGACCKHIIGVFNKFNQFYNEIIDDINLYNEKQKNNRNKNK